MYLDYLSKSHFALSNSDMHFIQRCNSYISVLDIVRPQDLPIEKLMLYGRVKKLKTSLLDINKLIDHRHEWAWLFKQYKSRKELLETLNVPYYSRTKTYFYQGILDYCKELASQTRKQDFLHEHAVEIMEAHENGWYIIFNTLTAEDYHLDHAFKAGTTIIRDYIRKLNRKIATEFYGSVRSAPHVSEYSRYSCVAERGEKTGRPHYHVLHFLKYIPESWQQDINTYSKTPTNRVIVKMQNASLWDYGFTSPIAVRYSENDSWGKLGWKYPYELTSNGYEPMLQKSPLAVAGYMAKYLTKLINYNLTYGDGDKWRIKKSRGFGQQMIKQILSIPQYKQEAITGLLSLKLSVLTKNSLPLPSKKKLKLSALKILLTQMRQSEICNIYQNAIGQPALFKPPANIQTGKLFRVPHTFLTSTYRAGQDYNEIKETADKYLLSLEHRLIDASADYYINNKKDTVLRKIVLDYSKLADIIELRGHYIKG